MQDKLGQDPIDVKKNIRIGLLHDAGKLLMTQQKLETPHMTVGNERAQMALHARLGTTVLSNSILNKEEQKAAARTIKDLEANFLPEQLAEFKQIAEAKINTQDEKGRKAKEAGFVANRKKNEFQAPSKNGEFKLINIAEQIRAAAEEDKDYNENGANKFIDEINRAKNERQNDRDREEKGA